MPPRRYPETDRPASEASGWPEGSPLGIAAALMTEIDVEMRFAMAR